MSKLVALPRARQEPDPEVIEFCRAALRRAESGQTRAVAYVEVFANDTVACAHVNKYHLNTLTGGVARLLHQLVALPADYESDDAGGTDDRT